MSVRRAMCSVMCVVRSVWTCAQPTPAAVAYFFISFCTERPLIGSWYLVRNSTGVAASGRVRRDALSARQAVVEDQLLQPPTLAAHPQQPVAVDRIKARLRRQRDVVDGQGGQLGEPDAGLQQQLQDRSVAGVVAGLPQQRGGLGDAERPGFVALYLGPADASGEVD